jgi:hypothetical protein
MFGSIVIYSTFLFSFFFMKIKNENCRPGKTKYNIKYITMHYRRFIIVRLEALQYSRSVTKWKFPRQTP